MGFHNSTPELKFICRSNLLLTINIDKNTETDLQLSVETAAKLLAEEKLEVVDFTSHVDVSTDPGHYVIFWEISGDASAEILQECCNCLDRSFIDAGYVSSRKVNAIGPLELRIVQRGTFHKILDHYVTLGSALNQFKTPRCVGTANNVVLQILANNVAKNFFSTAFGWMNVWKMKLQLYYAFSTRIMQICHSFLVSLESLASIYLLYIKSEKSYSLLLLKTFYWQVAEAT